MKKISTVQIFEGEIFKGAQADDRYGSWRSLVVLLHFG